MLTIGSSLKILTSLTPAAASNNSMKSCIQRGKNYLTTMIRSNEDSVFNFSSYDCIGFDLDNTLSRYKIGAMVEMEYDIMARFLVEQKGYNKDHLMKPFDHSFILKGLILDEDNGNILRIAQDGAILKASHGTRLLNEQEIERFYPNGHWEPSDVFAKDPLSTWNGPYSQRIRTLLDYFDMASSLLFARAVDGIDLDNEMKQKKYNVWPDIQDSLQDMFNRENFQNNLGGYFEEVKRNPSKYYYRCSTELLSWLKKLRAQNKPLFLITGSYVDYASHTATYTLGKNWRELFDITICYAKKPGFFTLNRNFLALNGIVEGEPLSSEQLQIGGIYSHGNWSGLYKFLSKLSNKQQPKVLYIGDNLIQDILTPNVYSNCDTVSICEELEAEGIGGQQQSHPYQEILTSPVWGSYFVCNNVYSNWYSIMKKHSKMCVPSLEYVASFPIDHTFHS